MSTVKKTHWLRTTLCVLLACGIAGLALTAVLFHTDPDETTTAFADIQFSFEDAARGIGPNGYPFSVEEIRSEAVITSALEAAGLTDRYTAEKVRPSISVNGSYPENILSQMTRQTSLLDAASSQTVAASEYHPTTYTVTLSHDFDPSISRQDLVALLSGLMTAYRDYFARTSAMGISTASIDQDLSSYDYPQALSILSTQIEQTSAYSAEMGEKEQELMVNGQAFRDIGVQLNNLVSTDITRMNGLISTYALTKDANRLRVQYEYEIKRLTIEMEKKKDQLKKLEQLIDSYNKSISYVTTESSLVEIPSSSSSTYDRLTQAKKTVSEQIADNATEIAQYQLRLDDLNMAEQKKTNTETAQQPEAEAAPESAASGETAQTDTETAAENTAENATQPEASAIENVDISAQMAALNRGVNRLQARQRVITNQFNSLIKAYNDQEINEGTVSVSEIEYESPFLISGAFVKRTIKVAGPICVLGLMVCLVLIIISRLKEEKASR